MPPKKQEYIACLGSILRKKDLCRVCQKSARSNKNMPTRTVQLTVPHSIPPPLPFTYVVPTFSSKHKQFYISLLTCAVQW